MSILTIIFKVFERIVYDQVESYLDQNKLLYKFQPGFRSRYSTDICLTHLTDFLQISNEPGSFCWHGSVRPTKSFDTVDYGILLMKLKALDLSQDVSRWFWSYLFDRQQLVDVSKTPSSHANISCGVPQGSILGPLLLCQ